MRSVHSFSLGTPGRAGPIPGKTSFDGGHFGPSALHRSAFGLSDSLVTSVDGRAFRRFAAFSRVGGFADAARVRHFPAVHARSVAGFYLFQLRLEPITQTMLAILWQADLASSLFCPIRTTKPRTFGPVGPICKNAFLWWLKLF